MSPTSTERPIEEANILLPYQVRWLADVSPVKVAEKSRRWTEAAASTLKASASKGLDTWYLGYNRDMALEFIETAAAWAPTGESAFLMSMARTRRRIWAAFHGQAGAPFCRRS